MPTTRVSGTVKRWMDVRGIGFVTPEGTEDDLLVHFSSIKQESKRKTLQRGATVEFEIEKDPKNEERQVAVNVTGLNGEDAPQREKFVRKPRAKKEEKENKKEEKAEEDAPEKKKRYRPSAAERKAKKEAKEAAAEKVESPVAEKAEKKKPAPKKPKAEKVEGEKAAEKKEAPAAEKPKRAAEKKEAPAAEKPKRAKGEGRKGGKAQKRESDDA